MITTQADIDLNDAKVRLASALREQERLEEMERQLAETRKTLAKSKNETDALKTQVRAAFEESVRVALEKADNDARLEDARREAEEAQRAAQRAAKIAKAKELNQKLEAIAQAARQADESLAAYTTALATIRNLKVEVASGIRDTFVVESWQAVPNASMERECREGRNIVEALARSSTDIRPVTEYYAIRSAATSFTTLAINYLTGFTK